jgi:CheY-like chemotaxis protein
MKILVVDDNQDIRDAVVELLQIEGYLVRGARDGSDALEVLAQETPDLIVLDMNMPRMDGREFLERQRQDRRCAGVRVIIMSANGEPSDLSPAAFIQKPFEFPRLLQAVEQVTETGHARTARR